MNYRQALAWLDAHVNLERERKRRPTPTLDRMRELVTLLGDPQSAAPVIHVTGTNGKTSTTRMISSLLAAHGLTVGTYTSPNLVTVNERMSYNLEPIANSAFAEIIERLAAIESLWAEDPSWFELVTAAALSWFADIAVDVMVLEVGLGGTWDATNVAQADIAVVTNVALDHMEYLGPTREDIATEKAGIVEPTSVLILGETDPALRPIFEARRPTRIVERDRDWGVVANQLAVGGRMVDLRYPGGVMSDLLLPLHGAHQADNAACALAAVSEFFGPGHRLHDDTVAEGFAAVTSPGRLEVMRRHPLVILDGAHNPAGAAVLTAALDESFPSGERTYVVGLLVEKDPRTMLEALDISSTGPGATGPGARRVDAYRVVACRPDTPRGRDPHDVARVAVELGIDPARVEVIDDPADAVDRAIALTPDHGQVVVTGTLYVVGAIRAHLMQTS